MDTSEINAAIQQLASDDGVTREKARNALVAAESRDVTEALIAELVDYRHQVRWEAAKALSQIGDSIAALPLVHAMDDDDHDVAWVAAEGVAEMGEVGLQAVLSGLTRSSRSGSFYKVAHHALKEIRKHGKHRDVVAKVMEALEGVEPRLSAPIAAYRALQVLRGDGSARD
ncbi:HEAT repeat domain-containing protein [Novipirellula sp. SH528]|uniref:HEAT repeat domain-containing protein n=1 Tax=Novipirellula sp. SH528 TaxID=3454466 RepID=UPI003F9F8C6E